MRTTTLLALLALASPALAQPDEDEQELHEPARRLMQPAPPTLPEFAPAGVVAHGPFVSTQVNTDPGAGLDVVGDAANEPSIARSIADPGVLIIGWRQFDSIASNYRKAGYAYSHDGGATWSGRRVLDESRQGSDPVLVPGPDGQIYYNTYRYATFPYGTEVSSTTDGGLTWAGPFNAYGGDKAWMSVDLSDGPNRGAIYQHWTARCNVSFNGGQNWSPSTSGIPKWGQQAVGPDGRVYVAGQWVSRIVASSAAPFASPQLERLSGLPFLKPGSIGDAAVNPAGIGGQTNVAVCNTPGDRYAEVYALQSSRGPDGGTLSDALEVYFAYSTDGGDTFSDAVRVNDDPFGTAWHWFGALAVAPNGRVDAVWNDTRDDPDPIAGPQTSRLYASYSTDGGRTWAPSFPVSPPFEHHLGYPSQSKLGDYCTLVGDDLGSHVAYAATFTGGQDVYYLRLGSADCDADGVPDEMAIASGLAADTNQDGVPDACQCPADLTGDGTLNIDDLDAFIGAFLALDPAADLDGNGAVNLDDVDAFVASFIAGCP